MKVQSLFFLVVTLAFGTPVVMEIAHHGITGLRGFGFLQIMAQTGHMGMDLALLQATC
jgi:hypothetical protein